MGKKGSKLTEESVVTAEYLVDSFEPLGEITSKKMFGGHGIFGDGVMFAIVDSAGRSFLRVDDTTREAYESAGSDAHGRMPYQSIPDSIAENDAQLLEWAGQALTVAKANKK